MDTEISFALIRKKNSDLNFDNLDEISCIRIDNCNITSTNNLELFSHVKELHLHHNKISQIDNLYFFNNLQYLDVSSNLITSDGLLKSFQSLPKCLVSINLTDNPCATDENALSLLQDAFPKLGIIIDTVDTVDTTTSEEPLNLSRQENSEKDGTESFFGDIDRSRPLNADTVLRSIVERKCKMQNMSTFNIDAALQVLKKYYLKSSINIYITCDRYPV